MNPLRRPNLVLCTALAAWACAGPPVVGPLPPPGASGAPAPKGPPPDPEPWRAERPKPGSPGRIDFPVPEISELPNGLKLYVVRKTAPVTSLSVVLRHGGGSDPKGKSGRAALTARMLTEGTLKKSTLELAEAVESLGSTLGADTSRDESQIGLYTLTRDVDRGLSLLAEVLTQPAFSAKEFERVRGEWLDGLRAERQEPGRLASLAALRLLFGTDAGSPVNGSIPDVEKLTIRDLADFHRQAYVPSNAAVVVVGDVDAAELKKQVEKQFGRWRGLPFPPPSTFEAPKPPDRLRVVIVDRPGAVQSALFGIQSFPKRSAPGHESRQVFASLFGGLFTSRLNMNLREKHAFSYGARAHAIATQRFGAFAVSTSVKTEVTARALEETLNELRLARDPALGAPIRDEEIARAKADLAHSLGARLEHNSRIADAVQSLFIDDLPKDYYARYPAMLAEIQGPAVHQAATLLTPEKLVVVIVGDRARIEPELVQRGFQVEAAPATLIE
jgi:zinc protease